jgi:four helix bundle protein
MAKRIRSHHELEVHQLGFESAMGISEATRCFPREERYSLTDQIRRSSRAVCANITEAWRRRRYRGSFVYRLDNAEAEAAEAQTCLSLPSSAATWMPRSRGCCTGDMTMSWASSTG